MRETQWAGEKDGAGHSPDFTDNSGDLHLDLLKVPVRSTLNQTLTLSLCNSQDCSKTSAIANVQPQASPQNPPGVCGLQNGTNSCFLIAAVQILRKNRLFRLCIQSFEGLLDNVFVLDTNPDPERDPVIVDYHNSEDQAKKRMFELGSLFQQMEIGGQFTRTQALSPKPSRYR